VIRAVILLIVLGLLFVLHHENAGTVVVLSFLGRPTRPLSVFWVLTYAFLAGALAYAVMTLPERFSTWRDLRRHRKNLKKMGKNLGAVIDAHHRDPRSAGE
jgi:uncharacterized integral membrane protein